MCRGDKRSEVHDYTNHGGVEAGKETGWQAISCTERISPPIRAITSDMLFAFYLPTIYLTPF